MRSATQARLSAVSRMRRGGSVRIACGRAAPHSTFEFEWLADGDLREGSNVGGFNANCAEHQDLAHVVVRRHEKPKNLLIIRSLNGRGSRIRTCDPLLPKQVRYQTALCPDAAMARKLGG